MVGKHTDIRRNMQRLFGNLVRGKVGILLERTRGSHRVVSAGADSRNAVVRLDDLARSGYNHQRFAGWRR